jgi:hypothetical protein
MTTGPGLVGPLQPACRLRAKLAGIKVRKGENAARRCYYTCRRSLRSPSALIVFTYVFLANAWLGDDAYITFRVVDNFVCG